MKNSNETQNNLTMTPEQERLLLEEHLKRMTPEILAEDKAFMDRTVAAMTKSLAEDNEKIFGTPVPEHLK